MGRKASASPEVIAEIRRLIPRGGGRNRDGLLEEVGQMFGLPYYTVRYIARDRHVAEDRAPCRISAECAAAWKSKVHRKRIELIDTAVSII